mmetsp:Transcript_4194/g.11594  ORF Transcript_4194/g.11594 Transcript_4194/m.11594 type:complete len:202 (-) Transcript_4194:554-1159(-)
MAAELPPSPTRARRGAGLSQWEQQPPRLPAGRAPPPWRTLSLLVVAAAAPTVPVVPTCHWPPGPPKRPAGLLARAVPHEGPKAAICGPTERGRPSGEPASGRSSGMLARRARRGRLRWRGCCQRAARPLGILACRVARVVPVRMPQPWCSETREPERWGPSWLGLAPLRRQQAGRMRRVGGQTLTREEPACEIACAEEVLP